MVRAWLQWLASLPTVYGPAWILIVQALAWMSFAAIYATLHVLKLDVGRLAREYNLGDNIIMIADTGGLFALAFALNRLLAPARVIIALLIVPTYAEPINAFVRPLWTKLFGTTVPKALDDGPPGTEELVEDRKTQ